MFSAVHATVQEWDLSFRLSLFLLGHVVIYIWLRYLVAPAKIGRERCLNALAVSPVLFFMSYLFREDRPEEYVALIYSSTNFVWLTPAKIFAFCMNRGQLTRSYDAENDVTFVLSLLFPISIHFKEKRLEANERTSKRGAYTDVQFSVGRYEKKERILEALSITTRVISKMALLLSMDIGSKQFEEWEWHFMRDVCLGWFMYANVSMIEDLVGLLLVVGWNIKYETNFDRPWMAQSITEFWSKRYNLVFARTLREFTYDSICSGKWILGDRYFDRSSPSPLRKMIAVLITFAASGIFHFVIFCHIIDGRVPLLYGFFFVVCGLVVVGEHLIKLILKQMGYYKSIVSMMPRWVYHAYVIGTIFLLSHYMFWPDLHRLSVAKKMVEGMTVFIKP